MKNVRIDALPSDRQVASKDCRVCTKRRIKCDRSIPHCQKCAIRGLRCPGFDRLPLRWNQGVASRGKLAGSKLPVPPKSGSRDLKDSEITLSQPCTPSTIIPSSPTRDLSLISRQSSVVLSDKLLVHFHLEVASLLRWMDSPVNPWRSIILPIAQQSACLRMSILSLAATHLSVTSGEDPEQASALMQVNHSLRDACLRALNRIIRSELHRTPRAAGDNCGTSSLTEMLATMLVLCYGEMFVPNSTDWKLHLRACRTIIDRHKLQNRQKELQDPVAQFLLKEVGDVEAFGSFSAFTREPNPMAVVRPPTMIDGQFWTFTDLIFEITAAERHRYNILQNGQGLPEVDMSTWRTKLEQASERALTGLNLLSAREASSREHFEAVIRAHYYCLLIYSYQALASPMEAAQNISPLMGLLFLEIQTLTEGPAHHFSHDVFFPLFIAGTESREDEQHQSLLQLLFIQSISTTGVWCNHAALQFLRAFWARPESTGNWIQFARENEQELSPFLIF
ncbi:hypothetical protein N7510_010876 [Penicillium lagena]|uniref:uncharacterized protein n=1 Tax=Penicillium lagena TaxID=94218 RepID=UPI00254255F4|nr:uncharacterized protein N7510_010876 [Penicillium lagena]KAJ5601342.1 hypothetical protein N7510_010876 [Penicillium lagena]